MLVWLLCGVLLALNTAWLGAKSLGSFYLLSYLSVGTKLSQHKGLEKRESTWWFANLLFLGAVLLVSRPPLL